MCAFCGKNGHDDSDNETKHTEEDKKKSGYDEKSRCQSAKNQSERKGRPCSRKGTRERCRALTTETGPRGHRKQDAN